MMVADEFIGGGCYRVWRAGLQHARTAMLRNGLNVTLAGDANSLLFEAGAPDAGTGIDGDVSIDWAGNTYYTKAAGAWASTGSIFASGGGGIPIPADNDGTNVLISATDDVTLQAGGVDPAKLELKADGRALLTSVGQQSGIELHPASDSVYLYGSGANMDIVGNSLLLAANGTISLDAVGGVLLTGTTTPAALTSNSQWTMTLTSNTNMRVSARGNDGVTRVANITLT
jgi:hypothetical protein